VNFAFDPEHIDAEAGETLAVTFKNEDGTDHTFTSTDPEVGETLGGGEETTFSVTVPDSGVVEYHCAIHPQMTGTIGTESEGSASSAPSAVDDGY
jgi:plastocyanin